MKVPKNDEPDIVFLERDYCGIILRVEEFNIHWVLISNGSLADIIYLPVFQ